MAGRTGGREKRCDEGVVFVFKAPHSSQSMCMEGNEERRALKKKKRQIKDVGCAVERLLEAWGNKKKR